MGGKRIFTKPFLDELLSKSESLLIDNEGYSKLTRDSIIHARCKCGKEYEKRFTLIRYSGAYCENCTRKNANNKISENIKKTLSNKPVPFENSCAAHERMNKCWSSKNEKKQHEIHMGSEKPQWFNCDNCPHDFKTIPKSIKNGHWCIYCSKYGKICDDRNCDFCQEKTLASIPRVVEYWSEKNEKKPWQIKKGSGYEHEIYIDCDKCPHTFKKRPAGLTEGNWCPYCCPSGILCDDEHCVYCFNRSCASSIKLLKQLSEDWVCNLRKITIGSSHTNLIVKCLQNSKHGDYNITPYHYFENSNRGCYTCGKIRTGELLKLGTEKFIEQANKKHNNFYTYKFVDYIDNHTNVIITCPKHQNFSQLAGTHLSGHGCPMCKNKTEGLVVNFLRSIYNDVIHDFRVNWCKNLETNYFFPFDICLPKHKIIIEIDGDHHFYNKCYGRENNLKKRRSVDLFKENCANENGYKLFRLVQMEIYVNKYNWKKKLTELIEKDENCRFSINNIYEGW